MDRFLQTFRYAAAAALLAVVVVNACVVESVAVDMPYMDEWEFYNHEPFPERLDRGALAWLVSQHNEHRIVPTRAMTYALYVWNGWSVRQNTMISFGLYCGIIVFWLWLMRRLIDRRYDGFLIASLGFWFSARHFETLANGYQSPFHFGMLFFLGGTTLLFSPKQRQAALWAGSGLLTLGVYSLAADLAAALAVALVFGVFKLLRARGPTRRAELMGLCALIPVILGVVLYFRGLVPAGDGAGRILPWQEGYQDFFFNLFAHGFGVDVLDPRWGWVWAAVVAVPLFLLSWRSKAWRGDPSTFLLIAVVAGVVAMDAAISYGRAHHGITQAKASRYAMVGLLLLPATMIALLRLLEKMPRSAVAASAALLAAVFVAHTDNWDLSTPYAPYRELRQRGVACARDFYLEGGNGNCYWLYPAPLDRILREAQRREAHFYRNIEARRAM